MKLLIIFIYLFLVTGSVYSQNFDNSLRRVNSGSGLHNSDFKSSLGTLTIYLPSDMTVGESVSGTVNFEKFQIGIEENVGLAQFFAKYTINVENRPLDITGNRFILDVPVNLPTGVLAISLVDSSGKITNRAFFPVRLTMRGNLPQNVGGTANFRMPSGS